MAIKNGAMQHKADGSVEYKMQAFVEQDIEDRFVAWATSGEFKNRAEALAAFLDANLPKQQKKKIP